MLQSLAVCHQILKRSAFILALLAQSVVGTLEITHLGNYNDLLTLQLTAGRQVLQNLSRLWGRPVHLLTLLDGQGQRIVASEDEVEVHETKDAEALCGGSQAASAEGDDEPERAAG